MPAKLKIEKVHPATDTAQLNDEWLEIVNEGDMPFNAEGCSITVARNESVRPKVITTMKAGLIIKPSERVRVITGSAGKKTHGEPPTDDTRNFHLFLKAPYLDRSGLLVRLVSRQIEVCRGESAPS